MLADAGDEAVMRAFIQAVSFCGRAPSGGAGQRPESFGDPALNSRLNLAAADSMAPAVWSLDASAWYSPRPPPYTARSPLPNQESAAPQPQSPYAAAKLAAEVMLLGYAASYGLEAVCLRYFNVYGPRQDPASPYSGVLSLLPAGFRRNLPVTIYGDGEQTRDFVSVRDVARANGEALLGTDVSAGATTFVPAGRFP
ncbi:MAG: NAD-dependent epimerase/dehydratase family protein [Candidatus Competibacteraceae bacterium]|nr:NAD-dependent epimerase/dehydratase family protein [Candidatus Competibacteraceae bacterium]